MLAACTLALPSRMWDACLRNQGPVDELRGNVWAVLTGWLRDQEEAEMEGRDVGVSTTEGGQIWSQIRKRRRGFVTCIFAILGWSKLRTSVRYPDKHSSVFCQTVLESYVLELWSRRRAIAERLLGVPNCYLVRVAHSNQTTSKVKAKESPLKFVIRWPLSSDSKLKYLNSQFRVMSDQANP